MSALFVNSPRKGALRNKLSMFTVEKVTVLLKRREKQRKPGAYEDKKFSSTEV